MDRKLSSLLLLVVSLSSIAMPCLASKYETLPESDTYNAANKNDLLSDEYGIFIMPQESAEQRSHAKHILDQLRKVEAVRKDYETSNTKIPKLIEGLSRITTSKFRSKDYKQFLKDYHTDLQILGVVDPAVDPSWK